jgi:hypothetical protein
MGDPGSLVRAVFGSHEAGGTLVRRAVVGAALSDELIAEEGNVDGVAPTIVRIGVERLVSLE